MPHLSHTTHPLSLSLSLSCSPSRLLSSTSSDESDGENKEAVIAAVSTLDSNLAAERYGKRRGREGRVNLNGWYCY